MLKQFANILFGCYKQLRSVVLTIVGVLRILLMYNMSDVVEPSGYEYRKIDF